VRRGGFGGWVDGAVGSGESAGGEVGVELAGEVVEGGDEVGAVECDGGCGYLIGVAGGAVEEGGFEVGAVAGDADCERHMLGVMHGSDTLPDAGDGGLGGGGQGDGKDAERQREEAGESLHGGLRSIFFGET